MCVMNIAVDARALSGRLTGDRTYWRGLLSGLSEIDNENSYLLFLRQPLSEEDTLNLSSNFKVVVTPSSSERVWSLVTFGKALKEHEVDVAHMQYTVPFGLPCKAITTVHDISFRKFPKLFSIKDRLLLNLSVPGSLRRASAILTVSENSRNDILSTYPFVPKSKVTATPLAVGTDFRPLVVSEQIAAKSFLKDTYGLGSDFVLSVGVLQPRKNLPMLIRAFIKAKQRAGFNHRLAIVGKIGWLSKEIQVAIDSAGESVTLVGYVPDKDLPILYECADLMVYPSLYEGFGLPPLEAMACGCPVIVGDNSSLPEVVGDAGILLSADDESGWEESLIQLIESASQRSKMRTLGIKRASTFSWHRTAQQTLDVYKSVYSNKRS